MVKTDAPIIKLLYQFHIILKWTKYPKSVVSSTIIMQYLCHRKPHKWCAWAWQNCSGSKTLSFEATIFLRAVREDGARIFASCYFREAFKQIKMCTANESLGTDTNTRRSYYEIVFLPLSFTSHLWISTARIHALTKIFVCTYVNT